MEADGYVIVDTGSHLTALPCSTCNGCGTHTDPLFDVSKSTTAKYLGCHDFDSCRSCENDRCIISQVSRYYVLYLHYWHCFDLRLQYCRATWKAACGKL
ncbi:Aspartic peptidase domain [Phytophthora cactorum]|nr:Aspartic peptidase domain [Phytophthora cactorum]